MIKTHFLLLALAALLVTGCSNVKPYHDAPGKNLQVRVRLKDDDSRIRADLDIYAENGKCNYTYLGSVKLDKPVVDIGLPRGKKLQLNYVFTRNSLFGGGHSMDVSSWLAVRPGYEYYAKASWVDGMYDLKLFESPPHSSARHRLALKPPKGC